VVCDPKPNWIANEIKGVILVAPNGAEVPIDPLPVPAYILERRIFDYDLARLAAEQGAEIRTKAYVHDVIHTNGAITGVRVKHLAKSYDIAGRVVIAADGVESRVGRFAGLRTFTKLKDMESCLQVTLANLKLDPRYLYIYFGRNVAPGGYLWVFPKNESVANVGLGISGEYARHRSAQKYLQEFLDRRFPGAPVLATVAGGVTCAHTLKQIVKDGLMLVGDAAHMINPISGGGIVTAMQAGQIAGRIAAEAVAKNDVSQRRLESYAQEWHKAEGKTHERLYKIKQAVFHFSDDTLNEIAATVLRMKPEDRTILNIFKTALLRQPSLILEAIKVFVQS